jgi:hypothetical protein
VNARLLAELIRDADTDECNDIFDDLVAEHGHNRANLLWSDANADLDREAADNQVLLALVDAALARFETETAGAR